MPGRNTWLRRRGTLLAHLDPASGRMDETPRHGSRTAATLITRTRSARPKPGAADSPTAPPDCAAGDDDVPAPLERSSLSRTTQICCWSSIAVALAEVPARRRVRLVAWRRQPASRASVRIVKGFVGRAARGPGRRRNVGRCAGGLGRYAWADGGELVSSGTVVMARRTSEVSPRSCSARGYARCAG